MLKVYILGNVAVGVKPLKVDDARERYLGLKEIDSLIDAIKMDADLLMFVELSLSTGGRMSAVMQVKKKDINLSNRQVMLADEKGKERYSAFLDAEVLELLRVRLKGLGVNDRIYTDSQRRMQRQMKKILDRLFNEGLAKDDAKNRVVIHTLRHTFASHLAINGISFPKLQTLMNHKDIKQTMRYAHLSPDSGRDEVDNLWNRAAAPKTV